MTPSELTQRLTNLLWCVDLIAKGNQPGKRTKEAWKHHAETLKEALAYIAQKEKANALPNV